MIATAAKSVQNDLNDTRLRPTITAAIITLDEERNLVELLPLLNWVDEVVVVDGGSSDGTVALARCCGCRVVRRRFESFADQRNHAVALACGDWILSLDADERPTRSLVEEIAQRVRSTHHAAFRLPVRSTIFGRALRRCGTQDDRPVRLFRRGAGRWLGEVHERLQVDGRVGTLHNWLTHETQTDLDVFLAKMHRYTTLEARRRVAAALSPRATDRWLAPPREIVRRLLYKQGLLDGPAGWRFCLLSGLYEWVLADRHRRFWHEEHGSRRCDKKTPKKSQ